jgi:hypothetical protein
VIEGAHSNLAPLAIFRCIFKAIFKKILFSSNIPTIVGKLISLKEKKNVLGIKIKVKEDHNMMRIILLYSIIYHGS